MVIETTYRIIITKLVVSFFFFWLVTDAILSHVFVSVSTIRALNDQIEGLEQHDKVSHFNDAD